MTRPTLGHIEIVLMMNMNLDIFPRLPEIRLLQSQSQGSQNKHVLYLCAPGQLPADEHLTVQLEKVLQRQGKTSQELKKKPISLDLPDGRHVCMVSIPAQAVCFSRASLLRKAVELLLLEQPVGIDILASSEISEDLLLEALYVVCVNAVPLVSFQAEKKRCLQEIQIFSEAAISSLFLEEMVLCAKANLLARNLSQLPPNFLTPKTYIQFIEKLASDQTSIKVEKYDFNQLEDMGAGAFCAVAQGSTNKEDSAIIHLSYQPLKAGSSKKLSLVGKGVCFDTGGHNLKPARYMFDMHRDMAGSAIVFALMWLFAQKKVPIAIDAWLAITDNSLSACSYRQNEIITSLNKTTIEIVHTDAEGRLILADTLSLAARLKPDLIIDFATLTGTMISALGRRYSGIFTTSKQLRSLAEEAGSDSAERVCSFPVDIDYEEGKHGLSSDVADIKQCSHDNEADHILAMRFLSRFVGEGVPWIHMDLSASFCPGGLGAISSDETGFGVLWASKLVERWINIR